MDLPRILVLFDYNRWANDQALDATAKLSAEDFTRDLGNSFRSVRDTLEHIMFGEWIWLARWNGTSPSGPPAEWSHPTVEALRTRWAGIERDQGEFLSKLTEESLDHVVAYINTKGQPFAYPLWQQLQHVVNHSTYHRGQITTMLRQLGAQPAATDFLVFWDAKGSQVRVARDGAAG